MPIAVIEEPLELPTEPPEGPKKANIDPKARPVKPKKPLHFPKPPAFKCAPAKFFPYWKNLPQECQDRTAMYVYATWPVLNHIQILSPEDQKLVMTKKKQHPTTNIAKPDRPFESDDWEAEILHRWGSGNYHFKLNDVGVRGNSEFPPKQICMCDVTRLENPEYPPVRDMRLIDMAHPDNASYIAKLRLQGVKFFGDEAQADIAREEEDMVQAQSVETLANTVREMAKEATDSARRTSAAPATPDPNSLATSRAVETVAEGAKHALDIIADSVQRSHAMETKAKDPREYLTDLQEVAKMMQPAKSDESPLLAMMKMQHETHLAEMQAMNRRLEAAETRSQTLIDKLLTKPADTPGERPRTLVQELKSLNEMKDTLREFIGGDTADDMPWYGNLLMRGMDIIPGQVNTFMHNLAVMRTGQGTPETPSVETEEETPPAIEPPKPTGPDAIIINVLSQLKDSFIMALSNGTPGSDFAAAIIDQTKNEQLYAFMCDGGKQGMFSKMQKHPELWAATRPYSQRLEAFADEFLDVEKVKATLAAGRAAQTMKPNGPAAGRVIIGPDGKPIEHTGPKVNRQA